MVQTSPPNAGGIGGRGRIATIGEIDCWNQFINNYQTNITIQPTSTTTNIPTINSIRDGTTLAAAAPMTRPPPHATSNTSSPGDTETVDIGLVEKPFQHTCLYHLQDCVVNGDYLEI